jgi:hypothetical protein
VRSSTEVKQLVDAEVARIADPDLRGAVARMLIEPRLHDVTWDYGEGEEDEAYPCWIVADLRPSSPFVVAYCEHGFGPQEPFGIISADLSSMGMDSQWFTTLEGGVRSFGWRREPSWSRSRLSVEEPRDP